MSKNIEKYDFKEGLSQGLEVLSISDLYKNFYTEITTPHRLEFYQIIWFQEGTSNHWVDFNSIKIKPNTLLFLNKNSVQRFDATENHRGKAILFTEDFLCKTTADTQFLKSSILFYDLLSIPQVEVKEIQAKFEKNIEDIEVEISCKKDNFQEDILRNLLLNFLLLAERERRNQTFIELKKDTNLNNILEFKELLEEHFIQHKQVSFYCDKMHITPKKLNLATTKILDKTPKNIINDRVLLEAKRLLVHSAKNIKEISYTLGFEEPTNFIKYFKNQLKKTPLEFREETLLA